jgi:Zn-dependent protease with chaperone function
LTPIVPSAVLRRHGTSFVHRKNHETHCSVPRHQPAVNVGLSVTASLLGVNRYLTANGLNFGMLLVFCGLMGFGGSFISLFMSKTIAKWSTGARVIEQPQNSTELWLLQTVQTLATRAQLPMPEVAVYDGRPMPSPPAPARAIRWWRCPRPAARHDQGRSGSRAGPRSGPHRQRRHG